MIPISSQIAKYKLIHHKNLLKYKDSYTIMFGNVLGHEKAFLLQNIFPVIDYYIEKEYVDFYKSSVSIEPEFRLELIKNSREIIKLVRKGVKLVFPDILKIEKELISMLNKGIK